MPIFYFLKITRNREEYCSFESCNKQVTNTKNHTKNQGIKMKFKLHLNYILRRTFILNNAK